VKTCAACHKQDARGMMSRISFMRKAPEGWQRSIKRMIRLKHLQITPKQARSMVRYLANDHGLAREEARRALYEAERRVHWSEKDQDEDLRKTCAACHTLGRVLSQQRTAEEWKLLKVTHLAFFPLARWQAFRGSRGRGRGGFRARFSKPKGPDRADRVLARLAKEQPLWTKAWKAFEINRREVPLQGTWIVAGHEASRGRVRGLLTLTRTAQDSYDTHWNLRYGDGREVQRQGKGLLYAGYSWRGQSHPMQGTPADEPRNLKEVLLLSADWDSFEGRLFSGGYNELGLDVTLRRETGTTKLIQVEEEAVPVPSKTFLLTLFGSGFPQGLQAGDFSLGQGVVVLKAARQDARHVQLTIKVAPDAALGRRVVSLGSIRGPASLLFYDTIDYITINPKQGLARVGGKKRPKQMERFEAIAMNRGPDGKLYTQDDVPVKLVPATWSLKEFPTREGDDDVRFVGRMDPHSGVFTPGPEGPNPRRKWHANNIGEVYVVARATLKVPRRPTPGGGEPKSVTRTFQAQAHLLVMVPLYVRWDRLSLERP